jgi:putative heme-binding domain-containing protein
MMTTEKPADWFLTVFFDPSRAVEYQATTADGRLLTGLLAAESGVGIVLRSAEGKETAVSGRDLEGLISTGRSPMPDGSEKDLSPRAVADLLAYFVGLRPQPRADAAADGGPTRC